MSYAEKIKAISDCVSIFGGTIITPKFGTFVMGFNATTIRNEKLYLYYIDGRDLIFAPADKEESAEKGELCPDYTRRYKMPIDWFSETMLSQIYNLQIKLCKEQLTETAFAKVESILDDMKN